MLSAALNADCTKLNCASVRAAEVTGATAADVKLFGLAHFQVLLIIL